MLSMRIVQRAVSRPPVSVESRGWKNVSDGICDMREVTTMRFLSLLFSKQVGSTGSRKSTTEDGIEGSHSYLGNGICYETFKFYDESKPI